MIHKRKASGAAAQAAVEKKQRAKEAKEQARRDAAVAGKLEKCEAEIVLLREQNARLQEEKELAIVREIQREDEIKTLKNEIARLRRLVPPDLVKPENPAVEKLLEELDTAKEIHQAEENPFAVFDAFSIYVVGGSQTWQKKVQESCPAFKVVGNSANFDEKQLQHADLIIINTNFVGHSVTNKARAAAPREARVRYIFQNNLEALYELVYETFSLQLPERGQADA